MSTQKGGPDIIKNGLVFYLDAANSRSYPGSGTDWNDLSRGRNNGTLVNGPTFNSANGGSIVFDGVDDSFNATIPVYTGNMTYFMWAYPISRGGLFQYGNNSANPVLLIDVPTTGSGNMRVYVRDYYQTYNNALILNVWNNICVVTIPGTNRRVYVNGVDLGSNNCAATNSQPAGLILLAAHNYIGRSNCRIASLAIYNRNFSATEVLQNYNATKSRYGL
jgi:hypothetical protein